MHFESYRPSPISFVCTLTDRYYDICPRGYRPSSPPEPRLSVRRGRTARHAASFELYVLLSISCLLTPCSPAVCTTNCGCSWACAATGRTPRETRRRTRSLTYCSVGSWHARGGLLGRVAPKKPARSTRCIQYGSTSALSSIASSRTLFYTFSHLVSFYAVAPPAAVTRNAESILLRVPELSHSNSMHPSNPRACRGRS
ncbi:hypothetical protein OH77DRAFT_408972 [Trametes cingulata]|nr:hypothetical protein OH77DRAFT_408972 [Trametes cingulata]